ncbi:hypothetical protein [Nocardia africana]|uniref:hypothetical protein n=1 Tax=Nocardia africana TaxID=134964 RepID=UPI000FE238A6|nr:hypothetical protein [Nocardia africana]
MQAVAAAMVAAAGVAHAAPEAQPGVTSPPTDQQAGVTPSPKSNEQAGVTPPPAPPQRPQEHSPLGQVVPTPDLPSDPSEYRTPPSRSQGTGQQGSTTPSKPAPGLQQDIPNLHAPEPVTPPKIIVPAPVDRIGLGDATWANPGLPADVVYDINGHIALMQRNTNAFLQSVGVNASRSDIMSTAMVLGGVTGFTAGAVAAGVPAAIGGGVVGGLVGGTIGGVAGAAAGTLIPVPGIGTVTSGVAGTAIGAAAGAAIGAAAAGVPAALAGGAVGATIGAVTGAVATAGDGSDYTPPPPEEGRTAPSLHDQARVAADTAIHAGEQAVGWAQSQPGGTQALEGAVAVGAAAGEAVQSQPWAPQLAEQATQITSSVVSAAKAGPATADTVTAAAQVAAEQAPFTPEQFGPLTGAANGALSALQEALR